MANAKVFQIDDEGKVIEVKLSVDRHGETEIAIEGEDDVFVLPVHVAVKVADAVKKLQEWMFTVHGAEKLLALQEETQKHYDRVMNGYLSSSPKRAKKKTAKKGTKKR